jgi:restriction endonuclease S subunit
MKFLDLYEPIQKGDFGLTDEAVYKSIQYDENFVPLWGGKQEHVVEERFVSEKGRTKENKPVTIFQGDGIIISLDGSAGRMTFIQNKRFALNHHAGFFKVKKDAENLIDPEFFSLFYERQLEAASVSEGSKTLTTQQIYTMDFDIPMYDVQEQIMTNAKPILDKKKRIDQILRIINVLKSRVLSYDRTTYQATEVPITKILDCQGGNSGLTEAYIYSQIQNTSKRIYRILTGSTNYETPQYIYKCKHPKNTLKDISIVDGKAVIHVVRKGKAGFAAFFDIGNYTLNDDAYLLYLREDVSYEVDLKWLTYVLKPRFLEYASSSDNGTWNKTAFFENVTVDLPEYSEQVHIVKIYERLEDAERRLMKAQAMAGSLFKRQVSTANPSYA